MALDPPGAPFLYSPGVEQLEPHERQTTRALTETMLSISDKTFADTGQALRSVHAKAHGLFKAEFEVLGDLPPVLAQGLFARPKVYEAIARLSTVPGDILPDSISTPRGIALKVLNVEGERLKKSEDDSCQDFIAVNALQFQASSGKAFLSSLKPIAKTTDRLEGLKHVAATLARGAEAVVEAVGGKSALLVTLGGEPEHHILGEDFFGQLPIRYGRYIAKFSIVPTSPALKALAGQPITRDGADPLRGAVAAFFTVSTAVWDFRVQLCTDLDAMPVEQPNKAWDEDISGFSRSRRSPPRRNKSGQRVGPGLTLHWRSVRGEVLKTTARSVPSCGCGSRLTRLLSRRAVTAMGLVSQRQKRSTRLPIELDPRAHTLCLVILLDPQVLRMNVATIIGSIAAVCSMVSFVPQAWKVIRTAQTKDISIAMYALTVIGFALWTAYGIVQGDWPLIATNTICCLLSAFILAMTIYSKTRSGKRDAIKEEAPTD